MSGRGGLPTAGEILALYPGIPPVRRALLATRFLLVPFAYLHERIPADALVFEMGCGQGVLANFLKEAAPGRTVVGMDLSPARIGIARSSVGGRGGIHFVVGDVARTPFRPAPAGDARPRVYITSEVLYLLPEERASETMRAVASRLRPGDAYWIVDFRAGTGARGLFLALESSLLSLAVRAGRGIPGLGRAATEAFGERARRARVPRLEEWRGMLARAGLSGEPAPVGLKTPFPQLVLRCTRAAGGPPPGAGGEGA